MKKTALLPLAAIGLALASFAGSLLAQGETVLSLKDGWKFAVCDNPDYAKPECDDSRWLAIAVNKIWEDQGFARLDGYAWYRLRLTIPAKLKEEAAIKDGLRFYLGKINNFDQTFLNGRLIGSNGQLVPADALPVLDNAFTRADKELWNVARCYILPADDPRIRWDRENVIAVRVFDEGGQGGLWSGDQSVRMVTLADYLDLDRGSRPFVLQGGKFQKTVSLKNRSPIRALRGTFTMTASDKLTQKTLFSKTRQMSLPPMALRELPVRLENRDQSSVITYEFRFADGGGTLRLTEETPYLLTPKPAAMPRINGPAVYGARTGRLFLYTVPATGKRPMTFAARNLPPGLAIDPTSGIISGRPTVAGEYAVALSAENGMGRDAREVKLIIGERIALTPPLGWNSWNCWGTAVDQGKVLASARAFKEKGLIDHGWSYVNIDDAWEIKGDSPAPKRAADGTILTNEKFPDMKALADRIHGIGLKLGIYSSPGPLTCAGYTASYGHERQDASTFAAWGIDYLKYDWCSYDKIAKDDSLPELKKPYLLMRQALDEAGRDIVYSLCQYGMGKVWEWGAEVGGNLWRTTGDITDSWASVREIGFGQVENARFAGPGHWNDPDMLVVGWVGWGPSLHPTGLTPDEQYTHISLWCLLSAPLLIGCDLERLDDFTLNLLTNDEVLAVDLDSLGKQAVPVVRSGGIQVWIKELADGGKAVGIFNLGEETAAYSLALGENGLPSGAVIRDLWRQKDLGRFSAQFPTQVPAHGVRLIKVAAR